MKLSKLLFTSFTALSMLAISYLAIDSYKSINDKIKFKVPSIQSSELNGIINNIVEVTLPEIINTTEAIEIDIAKKIAVKSPKRKVIQVKLAPKSFTVSNSRKMVNPLEAEKITAQVLDTNDGQIKYKTGINHYGYVVAANESISLTALIIGNNENKLIAILDEIDKEVETKEVLAAKERAEEIQVADLTSNDKIILSQSAPEKEFKSLNIHSDLDIDPPTGFNDLPELALESTTKESGLADSKIVEEEVRKYQMKKWAEFNTKEKTKKNVVVVGRKNLSSNVSTAISRIKNDYSKKLPVVTANKKKKNTKSITDYPKSNLVAMRSTTEKNSRSTEINSRSTKMNSQKSKLIIQATAVGIGSGFSDFVTSYEFVPKYDNRESSMDTDGEVVIDELLNDDSVLSGTLRKNGYIDTKVDLSFINNGSDQEINIPFLDKETYDNFLDGKKLLGLGGHIIIELSEVIEDAEVDSTYEKKIFLDENFKEVNQELNAQFILFAGVTPGNALITYALSNDTLSEKIALINDGELYFDFPEVSNSKKIRIAFNEKTTLGSKLRPAVLNEREITFFNTKIKSKEIVPGLYEINRPNVSTTFRNYLELNHLRESIFVGFNNKESVEIPDENFIAETYSMFDVNTLDNACIAQVNLSKELLSASLSGNTFKGGMGTDIRYIENDGTISDEPSELTSKIIILGELQGVINLRLEYLDDSVQYIQTICSDNTYLVEQL